MVDDVEVVFGAQIAGAVAGIKGVTEEIRGLTAPVSEIQAAFLEMGEALLAAFAVEKLAEFVNHMTELGEETERTAAILGISSEEVGKLSAIGEATGTSAQGLSLALERLQVSLQRASTGAGPAANALKALGLEAKDLIGLPIPQQLDVLADKISKFADGGNKTAIVMELLGRSGAQMIPILDQGSNGIEQLGVMAERTNTALSDGVSEGLASSHREIVELGLAVKGLGIEFVSQLEPAINGIVESLSDLVEWFTRSLREGGAFATAMSLLRGIADGVAIAISGIVFAIEGLVQTAALAVSLVKDAVTGNTDKVMADIKAFNASMLAEEQKFTARLREILGGTEGAPGGGGKPNAPPSGGPNTGATAAAAEALNAQIRAADESFRSTQEHLAAEVKLHQITYQQETKELETALDQRLAAELSALSQEQALYPKGSKEYQKAEDEKTAAKQKAADQRLAIEDKEKEQEQKVWDDAGKQISSAFGSQTRALLSGTETFSQAMKNIFADLVVDVINKLEKILIEDYLIKGIQIALFGPAGAIPGFDVGTDMVTASGLAYVHAGEQITPAESTGPYTGANAGGGGGSQIAFNVSAVDGASVQAFFAKYGRQIANQLAPHLAQPSLS